MSNIFHVLSGMQCINFVFCSLCYGSITIESYNLGLLLRLWVDPCEYFHFSGQSSQIETWNVCYIEIRGRLFAYLFTGLHRMNLLCPDSYVVQLNHAYVARPNKTMFHIHLKISKGLHSLETFFRIQRDAFFLLLSRAEQNSFKSIVLF